MPSPSLYFRVTLIQLFGLLTLAAFGAWALANANSLTGHVISTAHCLLTIVAMTFIPCSTGPRWRFLLAFVGSGNIYAAFNHLSYVTPMEAIDERLWIFAESFGSDPQASSVLEGPRHDRIIAFRNTIHPMIGFGLSVLSGAIACSLKCDPEH
jgi:hypothetical protein